MKAKADPQSTTRGSKPIHSTASRRDNLPRQTQKTHNGRERTLDVAEVLHDFDAAREARQQHARAVAPRLGLRNVTT